MTSLIPKLKQPGELLNHILELPELPAIIQKLNPGILNKLIGHIGLEDSAQIIALATADQLRGILDEDLWHSEAPGLDESFDVERFALWLEIMMENGSAFAACKVMELDEDLLILGLSRLVLVLDMHHPVRHSEDDRQPINGDRTDKIFEDSLQQEFYPYRVIAKSESSWDTVCALLAELNELDYDRLVHLLERCCRISGEYLEDNNGLYYVFTADEMLEEDVSSERQERREDQGFVTPASAAVFLEQARLRTLRDILEANTVDYSTRAYFRAIETEPEAMVMARTSGMISENGDSESTDRKVIGFIQILQKAEVLPASDLKMLSYNEDELWDHHLPLAGAMRLIRQMDPDLCSQRLTELSYLANTLISGCAFQGRSFEPKEAAEAAFSICNLGSEFLLRADSGFGKNQPLDPLVSLLKRHRLVKLFEVGWKILFHEVVLYTAKSVLKFMDRLGVAIKEPEQAHEMIQLANILRSHISKRRPWNFNDQMDYLQIFWDIETTLVITELLQEYPTLPKVMCIKGKHRESPFISSRSHLRTIRQFLRNAKWGVS